MNAAYVYLIASSWFFLLGWVVLLLVASALAFRGDVARAPSPAAFDLKLGAGGRGRPGHTE